jgi:hypothetical protein
MRVFFADPGSLRVTPLGYPDDTAPTGQRCDLLVFKNCYMSVIEAAVELQDVAHYVIASQSQVPVYRYNPPTSTTKVAGTWPHDLLLDCFDDVGGSAVPGDVASAAVHQIIATYYANPANRLWFPEVPYTLLDITKVTALRNAFHDLAKKLDLLRAGPGDSKGAIARGALMNQAFTGPLKAVGTAAPKPGNVALVDLLRLCEAIQAMTDSGAPTGEAAALQQALAAVVLKHAPAGAVCRGLSVYYEPISTTRADGANDFDLAGEIMSTTYQMLEVGGLEVGMDTSGTTPTTRLWANVAMEQ